MPDASYGSLDFAEQIEFFRRKLNLPTARWDDIWQAAHDRAFVVAGALNADLLADLRAAVDKAISQGTTLETFRADFDALVQKHGWTGWTGEGSAKGVAWRTKVIYETNLRTSYAAGRWAQIQEAKADRPYLEYRHNDSVLHPRPLHLAWDGKILPADDPWWQTHYPPNGWGCKCRVFALSDADLARLGKSGPDQAPDSSIDPKTGAPVGIDRGWAYAPGASVADELRGVIAQKTAALPAPIGAQFAASMARNAAISAARQDCLAFGVAHGRERLICLDDTTGAELLRQDGQKSQVTFSPATQALVLDPAQRIRLVHNHPSSQSLSPADLLSARLPGVTAIDAQGHNGDLFTASVRSGLDAAEMKAAIAAAERAVQSVYSGLISAAQMSVDAASRLHWHTINTALSDLGWIDYQATLTGATDAILKQYQQAFDAALGRTLSLVQRAKP